MFAVIPCGNLGILLFLRVCAYFIQYAKKFVIFAFSAAVNAYVLAQDELEKSIPFIPENIVDEYYAILKLCSLQLFDFEERWNISFIGSPEEKSTLKTESYKRTGEINDQYKKVNETIREYLSRLDVL